jgi:hypothetical protein
MVNLTQEQIENIVIDTGVLYVDYGEVGERILAPVRGENQFLVERTIRDIEFAGRRGKTKGLRRITEENAKLVVNLMDLSMENLALALSGATYGNTDKYIRLTEYLGEGANDGDDVFTLSQTPINPSQTASFEFWVDGTKVSWTYGVEYTISGTTLTVVEGTLSLGEALVASYKYDSDSDTATLVPGDITDSDYLTNIALVGVDLEGKSKIILLYNAMADNNLDWKMVDKDESVITVEFAGHWDPTNDEVKPYKVEEVAAS